ncbi:MAG: MarR family transcriptional regulator [Treponema sp.]|nr:MarR family transcriptional regulator [Treponema sp.]
MRPKTREKMEQNYEALKLENQLCFPLYAASREILRKYTPLLRELNLTYTQYIVMLVMWEHTSLSVGEISRLLYLDSGTLSPLLKSMEEKGLIVRERGKKDERVVTISITEAGKNLREQAVSVPSQMGKCINLSPDEAKLLYGMLYKLLG